MNETSKSSSSAVEKTSHRGNRDKMSQAARKDKGFGLLGKLGCVLGVLGLCLAAFSLWQQQQTTASLEKTLRVVTQQNENNTVLMAQYSQTVETLQKQLADNVQRTVSVAKGLQQIKGNNEENWYIAEIEYLLRAANLQLQTSHDVLGTMRLLKQANSVLNGINDYALFSVRKGIEEDIAALNGVPAIDITGVWLQLNAAISQVQQLPLLTPEGFDASKVLSDSQKTPIEESAQPLGWWQHVKRVLRDSWHFFSRQFYLRKHTEGQPSMLLSPQDEMQLRQNLQLILTQAQQALLIRDETIYKQSLEDASRWIRVYFHNSSSEAKALLAKLDYLQQKNISPTMPVITHGLVAVEAYNMQHNENNTEQTTIKTKTNVIVPPESQAPPYEAPRQESKSDKSAKENAAKESAVKESTVKESTVKESTVKESAVKESAKNNDKKENTGQQRLDEKPLENETHHQKNTGNPVSGSDTADNKRLEPSKNEPKKIAGDNRQSVPDHQEDKH